MLKCGLLGEKLGHSWSPEIHEMLGGYEYRLYEKSPAEVAGFVRSGVLDGMNVTIPYKKTVFPLMDAVGEAARRTGSINTVVRDADGRLFGDNTDVFGFSAMVRHSGIDVCGRRALIFGNGGAAAAVRTVLQDLGCEITVISRSGPDNYENLDRHRDTEIIVNATPLGMYPKNGAAAADLSMFPACIGVFDLIYNPERTTLLLQAEERGIPGENGLYMLVAQAKRSSELFTGTEIPDGEIDRIYDAMRQKLLNIVLIGMPGTGKTTLAHKLGLLTGRPVIDTDEEITESTGETPASLIKRLGEAEFRKIEHEIVSEAGKRSGAVIATGGGVVTVPDNYPLLHQNGVIVWLKRRLDALSIEGRPLSGRMSAAEMYEIREPKYRAFSDLTVDLDEVQDEKKILERIMNILK